MSGLTDEQLAELEAKAAAPAPAAAAPAAAGAQAAPTPSSGGKQSWGEWLGGMARAAGQGVSFNFGDELEAFVRARVGSGDYEMELAKIRDEMDAHRKENPWSSFAVEMAGSLLAPGGLYANGIKGAKTLGQAALRGGKVAAGYGALSGIGAGEGDTTEEGIRSRIFGGLVGGTVGGALGAAGPVVGESMSGLVDKGQRLAAKVGITSGDAVADKAVLGGVRIDAQRRGVETADELARLADDAKGGRALALSGGDTTRALARDVAEMGDEAKDTVSQFLDRQSVNRAKSDNLGVNNLEGGIDYDKSLSKIIAERRATGSEIDNIYTGPRKKSDELEALYKTRDGREAIEAGLDRALRSTELDDNPEKLVAKFTPNPNKKVKKGEVPDDPEKIGSFFKQQGGDISDVQWTPRQAESVLRHISQKKNEAFKNGDGDLAERITKLEERVSKAVYKMYPELQKVREDYATESSIKRALEWGREFNFNSRGNVVDEKLRKFDGYTDREKKAARLGLREALKDAMSQSGGLDAFAEKFGGKAKMQSAIERVFGDEGKQLIANLQREAGDIKIERGLRQAVGRAPLGAEEVERQRLGDIVSTIATTSAFGFPVPVYVAYNAIKNVSKLDEKTANLVAKRLTELHNNGANVEELAKRLAKLDEKQRSAMIRRLFISNTAARAAGAAAGEGGAYIGQDYE